MATITATRGRTQSSHVAHASYVPRQRGSKQRQQNDDAGKAALALMFTLPTGTPARTAARDEAIARFLPLAKQLARRFHDRGEPTDDLIQVATIGLIKAVDGFDPDRGAPFVSYAVPTITGELKRYFRDHAWSLRVPRRLQELKLAIAAATGPLSQRLGHSPTVADLAAHLEITEDEVIEGLDSGNAYSTMSLSTPVGNGEDSDVELGDVMGGDDPELATVDERESLRPLLAQLPERERRIVLLRFFGKKK